MPLQMFLKCQEYWKWCMRGQNLKKLPGVMAPDPTRRLCLWHLLPKLMASKVIEVEPPFRKSLICWCILYLHKSHNTPHISSPHKTNVCIIIVCNFSWDMKVSQEKFKTIPTHIFGGRGDYYGICASREFGKSFAVFKKLLINLTGREIAFKF